MNNIEFKEIQLNNESTMEKTIMVLIQEALHSSRTFQSFLRNIDYDFGGTHIIGAFVEDELSCINVFIRMNFQFQDSIIIGYQSSFSATAAKYRGQGIWTKLMLYSEKFLESLGGNFIFGFPNQISHPLFVTKLHYRSMNMHNIRIVRFPFWTQIYVRRKEIINDHKFVKVNLFENIKWKERELSINTVYTYKYLNSVVWGKYRISNKFGINVKYFDIGGMNISSRMELEGLLRNVFEKTGVNFLHISLNESNDYFNMFKNTGKIFSPVIVKFLTGYPCENIFPSFFGGARDTY